MPSAVTTRWTSCVTSTIWVRRAVRTLIDCIIASRSGSGNGNDVMLAGFLGAGELLQFAEATAAETQQEWKEGKIAGLQPLVGIEKVFQKFRVQLDDLLVAVQRCTCFGAQFLHLVSDALFGARDGALNRGVHSADGLVQAGDALFNLPQTAIKRARELLWHVRGIHAFAKSLRPEPGIFDLQIIFLQDADGLGIDEGVVRARQENRHVTQKLLIDYLRLGEISDLGGAAIINHRRQEIILHHGTEQRV